MSLSNFNLRGVQPQVMALLKKEAKKQHISVNLLILKMIEQGIGFSPKGKRPTYHDLDHLANTWTEEDAKLFKKNTKYFETIDKDLWL